MHQEEEGNRMIYIGKRKKKPKSAIYAEQM